MTSGFLISALALISVLTSLTVEALKKLFNEKQIQYSSNLLAVVVSVVLTIAVSVGYILYFAIPVTIQVIITVIALAFLSFLGATVGFDKIKQMIEQLGGR